MQMPVFLEAFNGCDGLCCDCTNRNLARAARRSAEQDRACAALALATAVLGAGQAQFIAEHREKRRFRIAVDRVTLTVDFKFDRLRHHFPFGSCEILQAASPSATSYHRGISRKNRRNRRNQVPSTAAVLALK